LGLFFIRWLQHANSGSSAGSTGELWEVVAQGKVFPQAAALKTRLTSLSSDPLVEHTLEVLRVAELELQSSSLKQRGYSS